MKLLGDLYFSPITEQDHTGGPIHGLHWTMEVVAGIGRPRGNACRLPNEQGRALSRAESRASTDAIDGPAALKQLADA